MELHRGQSATYSDVAFLEEQETELAQVAEPRRTLGAPKWLAILWQNRKCRVGLVLIALYAVAAVFAPLIAPYDPKDTAFASNLDPTRDHLLGTTTAGQDIF